MRDLNDLQFFVAVVVNRGFSAASRALGVPKSRISRRVALLEERLGVRLLDRSTRGLGLTQVGQQIYEHAQAAMIEADAVEEVALRMQAEPRGLVRLSCPLGLQGAIAGPLPGFLAAHPQLRVQCIATNRPVDLIHEGVDVAIRVRERLDTDADLQVKRIGVSRRILVASPNLLATAGVPKSPADLGNFPILDQDEQSGGTWLLTAENGETSSVPVEPRLASGSFDILMAAASQGTGITLLPARYCQNALASGALVRVLPEWSGTEGILHLVFVSRRGMLPGVRAVIDFAATALKSSAAS
ncbi:LysR family transcriptional regulator [Bradyrhizobium iriomotense]|uniref:Transcriptional regulator n=1 Tax=Bradyrhizobium iriomotense TaxID=441950 RepID=A0ABQ6AR00_9BRAD|nr:LysR family transcriptional regulator [Bradyrhizobium iriomotense]GLR83626.1 transcriptional regulator [Bradyrhizobium iriomotense]